MNNKDGFEIAFKFVVLLILGTFASTYLWNTLLMEILPKAVGYEVFNLSWWQSLGFGVLWYRGFTQNVKHEDLEFSDMVGYCITTIIMTFMVSYLF